jgi:thiamine-phosphate pyrophosphorylase
MSIPPVERPARLQATRLYFVCDAHPGGSDAEPLLRAALENGAGVIQLRDRSLSDDELVAAAGRFRAVADEHDALFILNDRPDLVEACGADGVHVGQEDASPAEARATMRSGALLGLSTHSREQIAAAHALGDDGPDYISVGPVWETPTKEGRPATGLGLIRHAAGHATLPWFAIGGINPGNVAEVVAAGARRAVVVRAIRDAADPEAAARALRGALPAPAEAAR